MAKHGEFDKWNQKVQPRAVETPPVLKPPMPGPASQRSGRKKFLLAATLIGGLVTGIIYFLLRQKEPAITVQSELVTRRTITELVTANGKIYPVVQVHISPEVSGEITELHVKEGQAVHKGDLLLKINPDVYLAGLNQAQAGYQSSLAAKLTAMANLEKAEADYKRNKELFEARLLSEADFISYKVARDVAKAQVQSAGDQVNVAKASVDNAESLLNKTTIVSPLNGTVSKLNSQPGERVLGTVQNAGTDIMVISDLSQMEARVDIGEMDIVLLQPGEKARLEVDSYKDKKFAGIVTDVANSSEGLNTSSGLGGLGGNASSGQAATQFQVRIRFTDPETFRPGMSVTAEIETRTHTNTIAVPIASITTRVLKGKASETNLPPAKAPAVTGKGTPLTEETKKNEKQKPVEVVFVIKGDHVKAMPVKIGISDENFWEIADGLKEGDEVVTGNYHAISHDLEDGKKVVKGTAPAADKAKL